MADTCTKNRTSKLSKSSIEKRTKTLTSATETVRISSEEARETFKDTRNWIASQLDGVKAHFAGLELILEKLDALRSIYETVTTNQSTEIEEYTKLVNTYRDNLEAGIAENRKLTSNFNVRERGREAQHQLDIQHLKEVVASEKKSKLVDTGLGFIDDLGIGEESEGGL